MVAHELFIYHLKNVTIIIVRHVIDTKIPDV